MRGELQREHLDVGEEGALGERVTGAAAAEPGGVEQALHHSGGGAGDDDRGALLQVRQRDADRVEHADQIDVDAVDEALQQGRVLHRRDAGVGHHDVDLAEFGQARIQRRLHLGFDTHVAFGGDDALALRLDLFDRLGQIF